MSVEENSEKKGSPTELAPQDDGTKILLKEEGDGVAVQQVSKAKYVVNPNGDAKIDIGSAPAFAGLTKEELMKYSNDPFWVRLRWFLFILFWLGWGLMLAMAIVIIVQAPGCEPPPVRLWVEQNPMIAIDPSNVPLEANDVIKKANELGISSVYLPNLIRKDDFTMAYYDAEHIIKALSANDKMGVTDLPLAMSYNNPLNDNATKNDVLLMDNTFNYGNSKLPKFFEENILSTWIAKGVKGFLMADADTLEKKKFKDELNLLLKEKNVAIASDVEDLAVKGSLEVSNFESFLEDHTGNWTFYKYKASYHADSINSEDELRLMNFGLFLFEGTPILLDGLSLDNNTSLLINELTKFRTMDGIKFGETNFANSSDKSLCFTRSYKGTPAYAVALNFDEVDELISFKSTPNIAEEGTIELLSTADGKVSTNAKEKVQLSKIKLGPKEGVVIQFVANFA